VISRQERQVENAFGWSLTRHPRLDLMVPDHKCFIPKAGAVIEFKTRCRRQQAAQTFNFAALDGKRKDREGKPFANAVGWKNC